MPFTKQSNGTYKSPSGRTFTGKQVKMYYATNGFTKKKGKMKIGVNNRMKDALGKSEYIDKHPTGKISINVKAHGGDKAELASTIKHEMLHVKYPKMTEKEVYKRSAKTKILPMEQSKLLAKLQRKRVNYKLGAVKRKYKVGPEQREPGFFINKLKQSDSKSESPKGISKLKLSIMGLV